MDYVVAVHKYWPNGEATGAAETHIGFQRELDARAYAEALERPYIGYVYPLSKLPTGSPTDGLDLALMVCIDGAEHALIPLRDGDDPFNAEAERGALDRAYEAKESNPHAVVSVVLAWNPEDDDEVIEDSDLVTAAHALRLLADLDEGENTDADELRRVAGLFLRKTDVDVPPWNARGEVDAKSYGACL